jgi:hypothetical protein
MQICIFLQFTTAPGHIRFTVPMKWAVSAPAASITAMLSGVAGRVGSEAGALDSAYQLGTDYTTGLRVAIGIQKAAAGRVVELYGQGPPGDVVQEIANDDLADSIVISQPTL